MPTRSPDMPLTDQPPLWRHALAAGVVSVLLHSGYWALYAQWWPRAARAAFLAGTMASFSLHARAILLPPHRLPPACGGRKRPPPIRGSAAQRKSREEALESSPATCVSQACTAGAMLDDVSPAAERQGKGRLDDAAPEAGDCLAALASSRPLSPRHSQRRERGSGGGDVGSASKHLGEGRRVEEGAGKGDEGWSGDGALKPLV